MDISIHRITGITVDEPSLLDVGTYITHITIKSDKEEYTICLFSDNPDALRINGYAAIYADNANRRTTWT